MEEREGGGKEGSLGTNSGKQGDAGEFYAITFEWATKSFSPFTDWQTKRDRSRLSDGEPITSVVSTGPLALKVPADHLNPPALSFPCLSPHFKNLVLSQCVK